MPNENKYYVYLHIKKTDNQIFYVGKGCGYLVDKAGLSRYAVVRLRKKPVVIAKNHLTFLVSNVLHSLCYLKKLC